MPSFDNLRVGESDGYNPPPQIIGNTAVNLSNLPSAVWTIILSYLSHADMSNLMLLNRAIKSEVEPHLYMELTLTEWASSGARLARAIQQGTVSNETCACIRRLRILFTSLAEIEETLQILLEIEPRMSSIESIEIESHRTEDAYCAVHILASRYSNCAIGVTARSQTMLPLAPNYVSIAPAVLPLLTSLHLPRIYRKEVAYLTSIRYLYLDEIVEDGSQVVLSLPYALQHITLPYHIYSSLGSPAAINLEITLDEGDREVYIQDAACTMLKLVATTDLPQIEPHVRTPSLKVLILCNIAPLPTIKLAELNNFDTVEFISIAPVTIPAVQALASKRFLPSLKLVLTMVTRASFLSQTGSLRRKETRKLVEWLQVLASTYPVDVRDFSRLLRDDIYFSDGLWCLAAQTTFRKYLPFVAPPPLKS